MDAMSDKDLIETFLQGDADAFSQIFEKYYGEALRMAYLITNNRCDSEYVVQDAFIRCYEKLPSLKNPEKFKYWFFRILTRTAWRYCGRQKREQPVPQVFDSEIAADDKSSLEILAEQETSSELKAAVAKLNPKQKTAVVLYYYNEFSVKEIAEIMHCTQGTVKSRLFSARKNLSKILTPTNETNERSFKNA